MSNIVKSANGSTSKSFSRHSQSATPPGEEGLDGGCAKAGRTGLSADLALAGEEEEGEFAMPEEGNGDVGSEEGAVGALSRIGLWPAGALCIETGDPRIFWCGGVG